MCTMIVKKVNVEGSGKGTTGGFQSIKRIFRMTTLFISPWNML